MSPDQLNPGSDPTVNVSVDHTSDVQSARVRHRCPQREFTTGPCVRQRVSVESKSAFFLCTPCFTGRLSDLLFLCRGFESRDRPRKRRVCLTSVAPWNPRNPRNPQMIKLIARFADFGSEHKLRDFEHRFGRSFRRFRKWP